MGLSTFSWRVLQLLSVFDLKNCKRTAVVQILLVLHDRRDASNMQYEIIRQPYLFMETMELLYKHINGISFTAMIDERIDPDEMPYRTTVRKRLAILQGILEEVCRDIDAYDPALCRYFTYVNDGENHNSSYLARFIVSAFVDYKHPGFDETVEGILENWKQTRSKGGWLCRAKGAGLMRSLEPGSPGDLFAQIYTMEDLPADFRLSLYGALRNFPETLKELATLIRPVAEKLDVAIRNSGLSLDEVADYWLRSQLPPMEFLATSMGERVVEGAGDKTRVAIGLMNANQVFFGMAHDCGWTREYNYLYIGCCIFTHSMLKEHAAALDEVSTTLRSLSERRRLDVLRRLAKTSCYGLELAESMNMDRGNLSRLLSVLTSQGFLKQEKENQRIYYRTNREAMQVFFDRVMAEIFD